MKGIKYDDKKINLSKINKTARYGKYDNDNVYSTISEEMFYRPYLELNNIIRYRKVGKEVLDFKLSAAPIELMSYLLARPEEETLIYRGKNDKLQEIAKALNRSKDSVYTNMSKLMKAGYLIRTEDSVYDFNQELRDLRKLVKSHIRREIPLKFDFLFKFCVYERQNNSENNKED